MSRDAAAGGRGEMTLAFALSAAESFADPRRVFENAREWSRYVGVVGNDTDAVAAFVDEHDLVQDFDLGDRDKWLAMEEIRKRTGTERHVFVGTSTDDRRLAAQVGWEFRTVGDVADAAGWTRAAEADGESGVLARLRALFSSE